MENQPQLLTYLKVIIASGSITAAAKKLYISQPYLSRYIHAAEKQLGAQLLDRQKRPIALTDIGAKFLQGIETLDNNYQQLLSQITEMTYQQTNHVRIGINQSLSAKLTPTVAQEYLTHYPNNHISFVEQPSLPLEEALLNHQLDFHLRMLPIFPNQIRSQSLGTFPIYLIVNASSPAFEANRTQITPLDFHANVLDGADIITLSAESGFVRLIQSFLNSYHLTFNRRFEMRFIDSAVQMAYAGLGCTFAPSCFVTPEFDASRCNIFRLPAETLSMQLVLAYLRDRPLTKAMREFMHVIDLSTITNLDGDFSKLSRHPS
ncbi:LysR family transcriptional regulator [Levilactobacillus namurensis]|uniref:LysR family transcriptional regulator n=1 Tax=Levilactobacillus namurensis TaxID=380393 RepID=UPI001D25FC03|nr:LysR family transcriptional regulator [Levilactobacillus namurensis]HJE44148.1 LysR family transcriptional regulator [Levilactobacillus namurensis]